MADAIAHGTIARGSAKSGTKLSADQVGEIRLRYASGGVTCAELGDEYGVHGGTILDVVRRRTWAWLEVSS